MICIEHESTLAAAVSSKNDISTRPWRCSSYSIESGMMFGYDVWQDMTYVKCEEESERAWAVSRTFGWSMLDPPSLSVPLYLCRNNRSLSSLIIASIIFPSPKAQTGLVISREFLFYSWRFPRTCHLLGISCRYCPSDAITVVRGTHRFEKVSKVAIFATLWLLQSYGVTYYI